MKIRSLVSWRHRPKIIPGEGSGEKLSVVDVVVVIAGLTGLVFSAVVAVVRPKEEWRHKNHLY